MSTQDEVEILSVVPKTSEGHTCARCGNTLATRSLLTHHQLMTCDQRTPAELRHARFVVQVAKQCGLEELQVFSLEREAGVEPRRQRPRPPPPEPPAGASLSQRLEAIGRLTLEELPDELVEALLTESDQMAGDAEPPGRGAAYQLDNTPLSYEVLRMPQYQSLFDLLRREADKQAPTEIDPDACRQAGIGKSLLSSLVQQADQLRTKTQAEFVETHYCHHCQEHVERVHVPSHVHAGTRVRDTCGFCGLVVPQAAELRAHMVSVHQMQRKLSCPLCRTRYTTPHAYASHVVTHRLDEELLLPGEFDTRGCNPHRLFEWQCELCREMPVGIAVKFREIREHATSGCRMLRLSEAEFNRRFILPPPREL